MKRLPFRLPSFAQGTLSKVGGSRVEWVRRWLFNLAAVVSLLLCLTTLVLWIRSYPLGEEWRYRARGPQTTSKWGSIEWTRGVFMAEYGRDYAFDPAAPATETGWKYGRRLNPLPVHSQDRFIRRHGFELDAHFFQTGSNDGFYDMVVMVPHWFLAILSAILPLACLYRKFRPRGGRGFCPACGYDLRATPERCPECGAIPAGLG